MTNIASKDRSVQRWLIAVSVYLELEIANEVSALTVGYHDQEFRSETVGLARKSGNWQFGLRIGRAGFDEMPHRVVNPWASYADGDCKAYLHYASYRT